MDGMPFSQSQARSALSTQTQPGGRVSFLTLLPFLPLIYILSTGPAAKLQQSLCPSGQAPAFEHALDAIYQPIISCAEKWPAFDGALDWYCSDVWRVK